MSASELPLAKEDPGLSKACDLWRSKIAAQSGISPDATLIPIDEGYSTEVYSLDGGARPAILRLYPTRSRSRMAGYLSANRVFRSKGLRVPEILATGSAARHTWVVEERIEGVSFSGLVEDASALQKAAETLAELHSHTRNRYGDYGGWGGFRLTVRWRQRFPERWGKVTRLYPELEPATGSVLNWFRDWSNSYSPRRYQLLHNDFHPGNVLLAPDNRVALLDLRSPRFGLGLMELIEAAHHFLGEEHSDWKLFVDPYLERVGSEMADAYEKYSEGCHAVFHLRQTDRFAGLAIGNRGEPRDRRIWERNALDSWDRFCRISGVVGPVLDFPRISAFRDHQSLG